MNMRFAIPVGVAVAVLLVISIVWAADEDFRRPIGFKQICSCEGNLLFDNFPLFGEGDVLIRTTANSQDGERPVWTRFQVINFSHQQQHPTLGPISWRLDPTRPVESGILSDQVTSVFPATADYYWHAIANFQGKDYYTIDPIHVRASLSFWPPQNTHYTQVGQTQVVSQDGGAPITLSNIDVHVNHVN